MKNLINGKLFVFFGAKSERITELLESTVEGMSLLGINTIMPIKKFKKDSIIPFTTIRTVLGILAFSGYSYSIGILKWLKQLFKKKKFKKEKQSLKDIVIDLVVVKEEKFTSEEIEEAEEYMCLCAYIKTKRTLIGVIIYGYKKKNESKK